MKKVKKLQISLLICFLLMISSVLIGVLLVELDEDAWKTYDKYYYAPLDSNSEYYYMTQYEEQIEIIDNIALIGGVIIWAVIIILAITFYHCLKIERIFWKKTEED